MKHSFTSGSQSQRLHVLHNKRSLRIVLVIFGFVLILGIILIVRTCTSAPSQATESNNATSEESASDSSSENEIVTTTTPEGITFTGPASFPDSDAYATLVAAINTFESNGFSLGFTLTDIDSGNSISYNADQTFYSASTIKAPYVIALYESNEHSMNYLGSSETVQNCLVYSDNEAYESLRNSYGSTFMYDWLVAAGFPKRTHRHFMAGDMPISHPTNWLLCGSMPTTTSPVDLPMHYSFKNISKYLRTHASMHLQQIPILPGQSPVGIPAAI